MIKGNKQIEVIVQGNELGGDIELLRDIMDYIIFSGVCINSERLINGLNQYHEIFANKILKQIGYKRIKCYDKPEREPIYPRPEKEETA